MNTRTIATIVVFTAISVALVPLAFPAPFAPFLKYQLWEIPIVAAFLIFGPATGCSISIMNTILLLVVYPGDLPVGPLYNLIATMSTLLGIYIIQMSAGRFKSNQKVMIPLSTALGCISRVAFMSVVNYTFLPFAYPLGFSIPTEAVIPLLPMIALFNASLALYTIPIGYIIYEAVGTRLNIPKLKAKKTTTQSS